MNGKSVLSVSAAAFGIFGAGWFFAPGVFYKYWGIVPDPDSYMGRRYGAFMLGLMVISWLARNAANTEAGRAIMMGSLACWLLADALSLYGALALGLNGWWPFVIELALALGFVWVLFVRKEGRASARERAA
ncbi:MAG TPA: hypothetical protein VFV19_05810 [Candidatus Polarisedimenticolaceae bacterium]|nr:hypothetical protein [Candidatus Polarisedimenticolaceae bacterium]